MHDGMPCGLIQGRGHEALKVRNSSIFEICFLCHFQWEQEKMTAFKLKQNI